MARKLRVPSHWFKMRNVCFIGSYVARGRVGGGSCRNGSNLTRLVEVFSERSIEDAFNDEAHRNLLIDGIEMMILGKVPKMVVLDYSAEALGGP